MTLQEALDRHIDKTSGYIKKTAKEYAITSKEEFISILRAFSLFNKDKIGFSIANETIGVTPLLWIKLGSQSYYLNSDTKIEGVKLFLLNKEQNWSLIGNQRNGRINKVTNQPNKEDIPGFYLYKEI